MTASPISVMPAARRRAVPGRVPDGLFDMVAIPGGDAPIGSTMAEMAACRADWGDRLVDPRYRAAFGDWIAKEYPRHSVRIAPFAISRFPVTNDQYRPFLAATGRPAPESIRIGAPGDHPVWGVEAADADDYAVWASAITGRCLALPGEAEWEWAARGPDALIYPYGDRFDATRCNTREAGIGTTTPVTAYPGGASSFGVWDMAGNVEEWVADCYAPYPGGRWIDDDLTALSGGTYRVLRGGCFALGGDLARGARRHGPHPAPPFRHRGFRLVCR